MMIETSSPSYRPIVGIAFNFGWCLAFVSLPAVAWFVRRWFWLQLAITLPKLLAVVVFWVVPESPRWLLTKNRQHELRRVVLKAAAKNDVPQEKAESGVKSLLLKAQTECKDSGSSTSTATVFHLLKTPRLRKNTLILWYNWLVNAFIFYALSYNTSEFSANLYLSFFLFGIVEFPAYLLDIFLLPRAGRKLPLFWGMMAGGAACALAIAVPKEMAWLSVLLPLVGKFCITATYGIVYVYTAEIMPTVVRSAGVGTGSTIARIGAILAPFVRELGSATSPVLPDVVYALLSISSGLLILLLPETNNRPIADTFEQAEQLGLGE